MSERLNLEYQRGEIDYIYTHDGEAIEFITRQGYRKVASDQACYERHVVYPIYPDTEILLTDTTVEVKLTGNMNNIMGAIGVLYKRDLDGYILSHVSIDDYQHKFAEEGSYWKKMPQTMIMKTCETSLIRMAYPDLFGSVYYEEEEPDRVIFEKDRIIKFIRKNMEIADDFITTDRPLETLDREALWEIEENIRKVLDER